MKYKKLLENKRLVIVCAIILWLASAGLTCRILYVVNPIHSSETSKEVEKPDDIPAPAVLEGKGWDELKKYEALKDKDSVQAQAHLAQAEIEFTKEQSQEGLAALDALRATDKSLQAAKAQSAPVRELRSSN